jgi:hypothetical protein
VSAIDEDVYVTPRQAGDSSPRNNRLLIFV